MKDKKEGQGRKKNIWKEMKEGNKDERNEIKGPKLVAIEYFICTYMYINPSSGSTITCFCSPMTVFIVLKT